MSLINKNYTCTLCGKHFESYMEFDELNILQGSNEGLQCPTCQEMTSHKRGTGRDQNQSNIQYGPCTSCGSQTEYFPLPDGRHTTQCPDCSRAYSSSSY